LSNRCLAWKQCFSAVSQLQSHDGLQNELICLIFLQARQKKKMMFGEQHLVRFGSMTKPADTDPLARTPQDAMDPQQVTHALLSNAEASCLIENSDTKKNFDPFSAFFSQLYLQSVVRMVSCLVFCGQHV